MGKVLLLVVLAVVVYLLFRAGRHKSDAGESRPAASGRIESMVQCAHCGVRFPPSEGVSVGERHYCSEEHRRRAG